MLEQKGVKVAVFVATEVSGLDARILDEAIWDKAAGLLIFFIDCLECRVIVQGLEHESLIGCFVSVTKRYRACLALQVRTKAS